MSEIIPCRTPEEVAAALPRALEALESGRLVLLPTETIYGLCARISHPAAIDAIYQLKGRPETKRLPFFVADARAAWDFTNALPRRAEALMAAFWPGPLSLVVGDAPGAALRCPDHPFTQRVLEGTAGPVAATSANLSGGAEHATVEEALAAFPAADLLAFDGGPCRGGTASTVAQVDEVGRLRILREGALSASELESRCPWTIAFVCTGNTCRSPMAAAVFATRLAAHLEIEVDDLAAKGLRILSAGLHAHPGDPMNPEAVRALSDRQIVAPAHRARSFDRELSEDTDVVLAMTNSHAHALSGKTRALVLPMDPHGGQVPDPIGRGPEVYQETLARLESMAETWIRSWWPRS